MGTGNIPCKGRKTKHREKMSCFGGASKISFVKCSKINALLIFFVSSSLLELKAECTDKTVWRSISPGP